LQYGHGDAENDEEAEEIFPVLTGNEGEYSGDQTVGQASNKNGNEHRHQVKEVLYRPLFQTGQQTNQEDKDDKKTYPYHN